MGSPFVEACGAFLTEPLMAVVGVVAGSFFILLDEPGVAHGAKLANEDGFGLLVEFGGGGEEDFATVVVDEAGDGGFFE